MARRSRASSLAPEILLSDDSVSKRPRLSSDLEDCQIDELACKKIMINVGPRGSLQVWGPDDVIRMQRDYHILGSAVGCFSKIPMQDIFTSLPIRLIPAEAAYLRDAGVACFVDERGLLGSATDAERTAFQSQRSQLINEQVRLCEEKRIARIDSKKDEILSGKLRKMRAEAQAEGREIVREEAPLWSDIREDLIKKPVWQEGVVKIEIPFRSWKSTLPRCHFPYPEAREEKIFYAAYAALMKAGFWLTSGMKYGGDLLLYEGDVHVNHSVCIVRIMDETEEVPLDDVLRLGRVATNCNKAVLWASVREDLSVSFTCSKWALMK